MLLARRGRLVGEAERDTQQRSTAHNGFVLGWPCGCSPPFINGAGGGRRSRPELLAKVFLRLFFSSLFPIFLPLRILLPSGWGSGLALGPLDTPPLNYFQALGTLDSPPTKHIYGMLLARLKPQQEKNKCYRILFKILMKDHQFIQMFGRTVCRRADSNCMCLPVTNGAGLTAGYECGYCWCTRQVHTPGEHRREKPVGVVDPARPPGRRTPTDRAGPPPAPRARPRPGSAASVVRSRTVPSAAARSECGRRCRRAHH